MYPMPRGRTTPLLSALFRERSPRDLRETTRFTLRVVGILVMPIVIYQDQLVAALLFTSAWFFYELYHHAIGHTTRNREHFLTEMVAAIEMRDLQDPGHGKRVAALSAVLGHYAGLSAGEIEDLRLAAHLHDIGKMDAAFAHVLSKNGPLTESERHLVQSHPKLGAEYVALFDEIVHIAAPIRDHHENWNGTGYPRGLAQENIHRHARYIRIADSLDAMLHIRPYRPAREPAAVMQELIEGRGRLFEPHLVDIALSPACWKDLLDQRAPTAAPRVGEGAADDTPLVGTAPIPPRESPPLGIRAPRPALVANGE